MTDFGRFRLSYEPGKHDPYSGILDHSVEMTISGEAELKNLTDFFTCFLKASGYLFDGRIEVIPEKIVTTRPSPYEAELGQTTTSGSQGVDFVPFSSYVEDAINFGVS
jgi:hypothetical protein